MKVHYDLKGVEHYLRQQQRLTINDFMPQFVSVMKRIQKYKRVDSETRILEIGTGAGWFPVLCEMHKIRCDGIEICPQLVEYGHDLARKNGVVQNIKLGNIEDEEIGENRYDVIVALSTFEHVEYWEKGLQKVYVALKPGGLFYFYSTNRFSIRSGEFNMPFYGWLPDKWRYWIRRTFSGEEIMKLGIDFNQFNHFQLKRFFKKLGFTEVLDQFSIIGPSDVVRRKWWKIAALEIVRRWRICRLMALVFSPGTLFICLKGEEKSMQTALKKD